MKTAFIIPLYAILTVLALPALAVDKYLVLKVTDRSGYDSYTVVTPGGLKDLQDEIRAEMRHHGRAMSLARKYWREHENDRRSFPASAIGRRAFKVVGSTYADEHKASEKASQLDTREQNTRKIEQKKEKDLEQRRYRNRSSRKSRTFGDETRVREKEHLHNRARQIYEEQLTLLMGSAQQENAGGQ